MAAGDLFPNAPASAVSLEDQIACVLRELGMREHVYRNRVQAHHMTQKTADREIAHMRAVLETLRSLKGA